MRRGLIRQFLADLLLDLRQRQQVAGRSAGGTLAAGELVLGDVLVGDLAHDLGDLVPGRRAHDVTLGDDADRAAAAVAGDEGADVVLGQPDFTAAVYNNTTKLCAADGKDADGLAIQARMSSSTTWACRSRSSM